MPIYNQAMILEISSRTCTTEPFKLPNTATNAKWIAQLINHCSTESKLYRTIHPKSIYKYQNNIKQYSTNHPAIQDFPKIDAILPGFVKTANVKDQLKNIFFNTLLEEYAIRKISFTGRYANQIQFYLKNRYKFAAEAC